MTRNVWHKRFHGDALNGYMGLTLEQRGAYTTLLDLMYDTDWEAGIPDRERWIAGHLNVSTRRWKALRQELIDAGKLDVFEGLLSNNRYRKERENALEMSRKRSESGAKGGKATAKPAGKTVQNQRNVQANASDLPLYVRATEAEAYTDTEETVGKPTEPPRGFRVPDDIPIDAWNGYIEMRKRKRANPTDRAKGGIVRKLRALAEHGHPPGEVLDQSTRNSWTDVYELKDGRNGANRTNGAAGSRSGDGFLNAIRESRATREANESGGIPGLDGMG